MDSNADSNLRHLKLDPTNPQQTEMAARATLEHAERVHRQIVKLREEHAAWYRGIQENEQGRVDDIVREAAGKVVTDYIIEKAAQRVRDWVGHETVVRCADQVMLYADVQELKRVGKAVRALTALLKGK